MFDVERVKRAPDTVSIAIDDVMDLVEDGSLDRVLLDDVVRDDCVLNDSVADADGD